MLVVYSIMNNSYFILSIRTKVLHSIAVGHKEAYFIN